MLQQSTSRSLCANSTAVIMLLCRTKACMARWYHLIHRWVLPNRDSAGSVTSSFRYRDRQARSELILQAGAVISLVSSVRYSKWASSTNSASAASHTLACLASIWPAGNEYRNCECTKQNSHTRMNVRVRLQYGTAIAMPNARGRINTIGIDLVLWSNSYFITQFWIAIISSSQLTLCSLDQMLIAMREHVSNTTITCCFCSWTHSFSDKALVLKRSINLEKDKHVMQYVPSHLA